MPEQWNHKVFGVNQDGFEALALEIFRFQASQNPVYKEYIQALKLDPASVSSLEQIPFLPVRFFKSHTVQTTSFEPVTIFESSGTTGSINSQHRVKDMGIYVDSFTKGFELFYGPIRDWCIIGLLPSYLERSNSSLVYMMDQLIKLSGHPQSRFYLKEYAQLSTTISELEKAKQKTWLLGVTFALLDFADYYTSVSRGPAFAHTVIIETGGMKGRREEMIRPEVHAQLQAAFQCDAIHSEYGMTELLSQAYSVGEGVFNCPPWMKILLRDEEDPFVVQRAGSGTINIIDLANIYSCSFIATDDVGKLRPGGDFEVVGRIDGSDLRGCSLMVV